MTDYKQRLAELVKLRDELNSITVYSTRDKAIALAEELHAEVERLKDERDAAVQNYASVIRRSEDENAIHRIVRTENERLKAEVERRKPFCHKCGGENILQSYDDAMVELRKLRTAADKMKEALETLKRRAFTTPDYQLAEEALSNYKQARGE